MNGNKEKNYETILAIVLGLLVIFLIGKAQHKWMVTVSVLLLLIGLFSPFLSSKIAWAWNKLSHVMGYVMSRVLLSIIFFVFLWPISLLARLSKKDQLQLKKTGSDSYYINRDHQYKPEDLDNSW